VKRRITKVLVGAIGLAIGVVAVLALREATLSTHGRIDPDTRVALVIDARTRNAEPGQTVDEMVEALVLSCRLEVNSDVVSLRTQGEGRFRAVLEPALDETNRKQLRGCLEDWTIDGLRADVVRMGPVS
jgi:hypothetical protein